MTRVSCGAAVTGDRPSAGLLFDVARTADQVEDAWGMVYRHYLRLGWIAPNAHRFFTLPQAVGPNSTVIVGRIGSLTVNTLTLIGSSSAGLPLQELFPNAFDALVQAGRRPAEMVLHADRRKQAKRSFYALLGMMRYAYWCARHLRATDLVSCVAHRDAVRYEHAFGFTALCEPATVGPDRSCGHFPQAGQAGTVFQLIGTPIDRMPYQQVRHPVTRHIISRRLGPDQFMGRYRFDTQDLADSPIRSFLAGHNPSPVTCEVPVGQTGGRRMSADY